jgi:hypothetical protein
MHQNRLAPSDDLAAPAWHVSSYSGGQGECIEVADNLGHIVAVRDSKHREGPVLVFSRDAWAAFLAHVR